MAVKVEVDVADLDPNAITGTGPEIGGEIILAGHSDDYRTRAADLQTVLVYGLCA
jgi:hypothetical protein